MHAMAERYTSTMRWYPRLKRSTRLRIALLAIAALLFQQTALAAYVCSVADMPATNVAMTAHCGSMPMVQAPGDPALCVPHCAQTPVPVPSVSSPQVPPLILPALLPANLQLTPIRRPATCRYAGDALQRTRGVSPELRFDVLLI